MASDKPTREYLPIELGGVLDESATPSKGTGLTATDNLIYRRFGAWGKRSGSTQIYAATPPPNPPPTPPAPPPPYTPPGHTPVPNPPSPPGQPPPPRNRVNPL